MLTKWIKTILWNIVTMFGHNEVKCTWKPQIYRWVKGTLWISNNLMGKGLHKQILGILDTFTVLLIWFVLAVCISIASEDTINTLPTGALELGFWAYRTIELITVIFTFSKPIAPPRNRDTVNFSRETSKLLRRTCWGFCKVKGAGEWQKQNNCHREVQTHLTKVYLIIKIYKTF